MLFLKQSTEITFKIGPFLDATDGVSEETGLAGGGTEISKNGAAFAAGPTLGTHDAEGWYPITLTTTHTNTLGRFQIKSHASATHLPVWHECMVLPANVYDSLVAGSDVLQADVTQLSGDATAADNAESFFDGTGYAGTNNVIPTVTTLTGHTAQTGDSFARLGAPAGASVSADIATVDANVDTLLTRITSTLFSGITSLAEWLGLIAGKQTGDATARAEVRATGAGSGTYDETTDSLEAVRDHVGDGTNLTEAGGDGDHLTLVGGTGSNFSGIPWNAAWDAEVQSECTDALNAYDPPTRTEATSDKDEVLTRLGTPAGASVSADIATAQTDLTQIKADLPIKLTKNTALANFMFKMVDETDGYTAETGISVTAERSLDGAAFAACANSVTEVASGWYRINLAAGDLNGDTVVLKFTGTGCRAAEFSVITQAT